MFKKITVATAKSARPLLGVFREDLESKPASDVPKASRKALQAAIATPGFKADVGETMINDKRLQLISATGSTRPAFVALEYLHMRSVMERSEFALP